MAHISETGYAKNVANFESLITSIIAFKPPTIHQKKALTSRITVPARSVKKLI